jgi:hypothetical protein
MKTKIALVVLILMQGFTAIKLIEARRANKGSASYMLIQSAYNDGYKDGRDGFDPERKIKVEDK